MEVENLISINALTALFTLINMILTFLILKKFLFKPVKKMIADRQAEIDGLYADAKNAQDEAGLLKADYEKKLENAKETSAELLRSATADANKRSEEILKSAREDADALKEKAMDDIAKEKKRALNEMKDDISVIAMDIAEKVIQKEIRAEDHQALIDDFIEKMGEAN